MNATLLQSQIAQFLVFGAFAYDEVGLWRSPEGTLDVYVYTEAPSPSGATEQEFRRKTDRADLILSQAGAENSEFAAMILNLPRVYYFCYPYGHGSFAMAWAKRGKIEWGALNEK